ncbi:MAG: Fe-S cluster assembly protein SufD [Bdellovibrionota bacterium]
MDNNFESQFNSLPVSDFSTLNSTRNAAFTLFKEIGFPNRRHEEWKYTSVNAISTSNFKTPSRQQSDRYDVSRIKQYINDDDINIIFIDGFIANKTMEPPCLPEGLTIVPIIDSFSNGFCELSCNLITMGSQSEENAFTALNRAMIEQGVLINIKKNTQIKKTIHLLFLQSGQQQDSAIFPRILINLEPYAEAQILQTHISDDSDSEHYFTNAAIDVALQQGSILRHYKSQIESKNALHISHMNVEQKQDSSFHYFGIDCGAKLARNSINVSLQDKGAHASLGGIYLTHNTQHIDNHVSIDHKAPDCSSNQFYKGILDDNSRAVFNGKIFVRKNAQRTSAFQTNKNILLSEAAEIDSKPQLEIDADDVKCSHGAAIGQLDKNEIFYFKTRGIPESIARKMLCQAFAEEAVLKIESPNIRKIMQEYVHAAIEGEEACQIN